MELTEFEQKVVEDRLEGWEIVDFLQVPVDQILFACQQNDWINEDNIEDFLEFIGIKR